MQLRALHTKAIPSIRLTLSHMASPLQNRASYMSAPGLQSVVALFDQFKKLYDAGEAKADEASGLLAKLKIAMLSFTSLVSRKAHGQPIISGKRCLC